jgi:hypothetical protein
MNTDSPVVENESTKMITQTTINSQTPQTLPEVSEQVSEQVTSDEFRYDINFYSVTWAKGRSRSGYMPLRMSICGIITYADFSELVFYVRATSIQNALSEAKKNYISLMGKIHANYGVIEYNNRGMNDNEFNLDGYLEHNQPTVEIIDPSNYFVGLHNGAIRLDKNIMIFVPVITEVTILF